MSSSINPLSKFQEEYNCSVAEAKRAPDPVNLFSKYKPIFSRYLRLQPQECLYYWAQDAKTPSEVIRLFSCFHVLREQAPFPNRTDLPPDLQGKIDDWGVGDMPLDSLDAIEACHLHRVCKFKVNSAHVKAMRPGRSDRVASVPRTVMPDRKPPQADNMEEFNEQQAQRLAEKAEQDSSSQVSSDDYYEPKSARGRNDFDRLPAASTGRHQFCSWKILVLLAAVAALASGGVVTWRLATNR